MTDRLALVLTLAGLAVIGGCDFDPAAMNTKLGALDARVARLEALDARVAKLEAAPPAPAIPTVLWVQNPGEYPRASAYFASKEECAATAAQWGWPHDKKAKVIVVDPWITQSGTKDQSGQPLTLTVSCLPQGVAPFPGSKQ